jgi:hypothetical protein
MELIMDFKEGSLIRDFRGNIYLVSFKTLYNLVLIDFTSAIKNYSPYSDWQNNLPLFAWKNYNLTNKDDIILLNAKFDGSLDVVINSEGFDKVYGVEIGSVVEFDYKQMMLIGKTDRKILSFTLERPVLFDFNKVKEKYIVFDRLNKLSDLQSEFNSNWSEYLITPFASKQNIDWTVVRDKLPFEELIGKEFIDNEFVQIPTENITLADFYSVINTKKLNLIKDESIKNEILELIKQTLILAKENNSIGSKSEPKKTAEPIIDTTDEKANKTLYKINVVVSAMDKDGGTKYPKIFDVYADSETEALEKIRQDFEDDKFFKLGDLYYDYDEVVEVIPPTKKEPVLEKQIEETDNLDDLLALYKIEETENLDDLLKLYE